MIFLTLDNKDWCKGIYQNGELHFDKFPKDMSTTWKYATYLKDLQVEYVYLIANGKSIDQICPEHLLNKWKLQKNKLSAFHTSFVESKISLEENCFFDLVPEQFLLELCETKSQILEDYLKAATKPSNYDLLLETEKVIADISNRKLNLDIEFLKKNTHKNRARLLLNKISKTKSVEYNLFGSKTGRLTTKQGTFPILNLDTELRGVIKPTNDLFVELDFNAAEARVLLALSGQDQPEEDIHLWNSKRLGISREEAKKELFAWLYGSQKIDGSKYENLFKLNKVMDRFYDGETITNFFRRKIKSDDFHKLNYLVQSTSNDLVLEQVSKLFKMLENKKSHISFLVHDSVVIDLAKEDKTIVNQMLKVFSETSLGNFPVNISIGKDYGSLRKIKC